MVDQVPQIDIKFYFASTICQILYFIANCGANMTYLVKSFCILSLTSLLLVFWGCNSNNNKGTKEKLVVWTSSEHVKLAIDTVAERFEDDFEVEVEVLVLNKDLTSQFKTAAVSGKGPDIFTWAHDVVGELASSGLIEPVNISSGLQKAFIPVALDAFRYKGKIYGYPYDLEAIALIYNKDIMSDVPKSMEELVEFSKKLKRRKPNLYGFLYDIGNFFFSFPFLSANGGYIFKKEKGQTNVFDIGLANDGAIAGGKFIASLVKDEVIPESTDRSIAFNLMKKGELAATIDGPWSMTDLKKSGINFRVAPIPTLNGGRPKPFVGTHGFIVRRSSDKKALAKEFIENYLVTKAGIMTLYEIDPRGPSRMDVVKELEGEVHLKQFLDSAASGVPMPNVPQMGAVWGAMSTALRFIINGEKKPRKSLHDAVEQIKASIAK